MAFRLESDLRGPVGAWLAEAGFAVRSEVPLYGRRADLIGTREDGLAAVEMKLISWPDALRQAIAYQIVADWSWVAMPLASAARAHRHRWRFDRDGVGLLAVDDFGSVRQVIPASRSSRLLPFAQDAMRARIAAAVQGPGGPLSTGETGLEAF